MLDWQCESFNCNTKIKDKSKNYVGVCTLVFYKEKWFIAIISVGSFALLFLIIMCIVRYKRGLERRL